MKKQVLVMAALTGTLALTGLASPASATAATATAGKPKPQLVVYTAKVAGFGTAVSGTAGAVVFGNGDVKSGIEVSKLPEGTYTYRILYNDMPAPGGGGHFTQLSICTLNVSKDDVRHHRAEHCKGEASIPAGTQLTQASASVDSTVTSLAVGALLPV